MFLTNRARQPSETVEQDVSKAGVRTKCTEDKVLNKVQMYCHDIKDQTINSPI